MNNDNDTSIAAQLASKDFDLDAYERLCQSKDRTIAGLRAQVAEHEQQAATIAALRQRVGDLEAAQSARHLLTEQEARDMGANGGPICHQERKLFEAWMRGHCWEPAPWQNTPKGGEYTDMITRMLWAAWRDRAALAAARPSAALTDEQLANDIEMVAGALDLCEPEDQAAFNRIRAILAASGRTEQAVPHSDPVPEGWKLVPVTPTDDMADAYIDNCTGSYVDDCTGRPHAAFYYDAYTAMLAAAPVPPASAPAGTINGQPVIGKLLDDFSALPLLWGLSEPGALVRHSDVFKMLVDAGKAMDATAIRALRTDTEGGA